MVSALSSYFRNFMLAPLVLASLFLLDAMRPDVLYAKEASTVPDYVIKEFGKPPAIPKGSLSKDVQSAVQVAFIDGIKHSAWGRDQGIALNKIVQSKDPRLFWIISDLMRFTAGQQLNDALTDAAS